MKCGWQPGESCWSTKMRVSRYTWEFESLSIWASVWDAVRDGASGQSVCGCSENAGASPVRTRLLFTHNMFQKQETRLVEVVVDWGLEAVRRVDQFVRVVELAKAVLQGSAVGRDAICGSELLRLHRTQSGTKQILWDADSYNNWLEGRG